MTDSLHIYQRRVARNKIAVAMQKHGRFTDEEMTSLGLTEHDMSRIFSEPMPPDMTELKMLAEHLGVDLSDILSTVCLTHLKDVVWKQYQMDALDQRCTAVFDALKGIGPAEQIGILEQCIDYCRTEIAETAQSADGGLY